MNVRSDLRRLAGPRQPLPVDADALEEADGEPASLQMFNIPLFVAAPPLLKNLLERVPIFRLLEPSVRDLDVERGQMPAMQMADEVGR